MFLPFVSPHWQHVYARPSCPGPNVYRIASQPLLRQLNGGMAYSGTTRVKHIRAYRAHRRESSCFWHLVAAVSTGILRLSSRSNTGRGCHSPLLLTAHKTRQRELFGPDFITSLNPLNFLTARTPSLGKAVDLPGRAKSRSELK